MCGRGRVAMRALDPCKIQAPAPTAKYRPAAPLFWGFTCGAQKIVATDKGYGHNSRQLSGAFPMRILT